MRCAATIMRTQTATAPNPGTTSSRTHHPGMPPRTSNAAMFRNGTHAFQRGSPDFAKTAPSARAHQTYRAIIVTETGINRISA